MKKLNPVHFVKFVNKYIKEVRAYLYYRKTVTTLAQSGELTKRGLRVDAIKRIYFVENLSPEVLLYGEQEAGGLDRFEKSFIAEKLRIHNDMFINNQLIDLVRTSLDRIKTKDVYAYLVKINFNFSKFTLLNTLYIIFYLSGVTLLTLKIISLWPVIQGLVHGLVGFFG